MWHPGSERRRRWHEDGEAGFTMLELLVVIAILAVVSSAVLLRPTSRRSGIELAELSTTIASELRNTRADAMTSGTDRTVLFDTDRRLVRSEQRGHTIIIDDDISMVATTAASERRGGGQMAVRFFPNGSSTGGALRLERGKTIHEVRINWLTGRVMVAPL